MTPDLAQHGMRRSSSWNSFSSANMHIPSITQLVTSKEVAHVTSIPNSRNLTHEMNNNRVQHNRSPKHTSPMKTAIRVLDSIKIRFLEQQEQLQRSSVSKGNEVVRPRPQSAIVRQRRNPSPTPPMRVLRVSRQKTIPEESHTRQQSAHGQRPIHFMFSAIKSSEVDRIKSNEKSGEGSYTKGAEGLQRQYQEKTHLPATGVKEDFKIERYVKNVLTPLKTNVPVVGPKQRYTSKFFVKKEEIVRWMQENGIVFTNSSKREIFNEPSAADAVSCMFNGVKLAELVERLENIELRGIDRTSSKHAAIYNNINKALEPLRSRKNMNPRYLWSMEDIMKGKTEVMWGLLEDIYVEYNKSKKKDRDKSASGKTKQSSVTIPVTLTTATPKKVEAKKTAHSGVKYIETTVPSDKNQSHINMIQNDSMQKIFSDSTKNKEQSIKDMEAAARAWLHKINFDVLLTHRTCDHNDLLKDILRNGVFLGELVTTLQQRPSLMKNVIIQPRRVEEAQSNVKFVLSLLKGNNNIPATYLYENCAERILGGERNAIWTLIYYIMQCYPNAVSNLQQHYSKTNTLYLPEQMRNLEHSLLFWLRSIGMLPATEGMNLHQTLEFVEAGIRNGTLLCDLVSFIMGERIIGVNRTPKVSAACLSNISKALELLRKRKSMTQEYLWSEKDLLDGNKNVILGLLEDLHRCYDKVAPRTSSSSKNMPYIGKMPLIDFNFPQNVHQSPSKMGKISAGKMTTSHHQLLGTNVGNIPLPVTPPTELKTTIPTPSKYTSIELRSYPEPFFPSSHLSNVLIPEPYEIDISMNALYENNNAFDNPSSVYTSRNYLQQQKQLYQAHMQCTTYQQQRQQTVEQNDKSDSKQPSSAFLLAKWLESIGIKLLSSFSLESPTVPEFSDGILLCNIVSALEHKEIQGVTHKPKKVASYLHNIRKALEVLRRKKNMPMDHLWSENEIQKGNSVVICELLEQMRKAYHSK